MKFGLFGGGKVGKMNPLGDSHSYRDFVEYIKSADRLGYESIFLVEHHFTGAGQLSASLNLLSYIAACTSRIRLGTAVTVLPWHNPVLLAEQVATLDLLSGGRVDMGVGRGYRKNEFASFCIPMEEAQDRFTECLDLMLKSWTSKERFSHHGERWNFESIIVEPGCVQTPHPPVWMAAGSASGIAHVAGRNFNLLVDQLGSIDETIQKVRIYCDSLEAAGFTPDAARVGVTRALHVVTTDSEREKAYARRRETIANIGDLARRPGALSQPTFDADVAYDDAALIGTPAEIIEQLNRLAEGGVEYVLLTNATASEDSLQLFAEEIIPHVQPAKVTAKTRHTAAV